MFLLQLIPLSFVSDEPSKIIELYKDDAGVTKDKSMKKDLMQLQLA